MSLNRHSKSVAMLLACLAATSCIQRDDSSEVDKGVVASGVEPTQVAPVIGASSAAKLPLTGLYPKAAASLMLAAPGATIPAPEGCSWTARELLLPGDDAILYRAARCASGTTELSYVPGKPFARFTLTASPYGDPIEDIDVMARMIKASNEAELLAFARGFIEDPAERARCQLRRADIEGWPRDALVIDEVPAPPADGVRSACGELGLDEGSQTFWRLHQGRAWFFQLGQESPIVDAGSFTLVHKSGKGAWQRQ